MNEKAIMEKTVEATILQNLKYVKSSIQNGTLQNQKEILKLVLVDTVEAINGHYFTFKVKYSVETQKQHMQTYINQALKAKASLLADMEEVERELFSRFAKPKRAEAIINKMLVTNLYKNPVKIKVDRWTNTLASATKTQVIYAV